MTATVDIAVEEGDPYLAVPRGARARAGPASGPGLSALSPSVPALV
ncbi:hypothetical protein [Streptomyces macrosporus]|uniref:Uncharacterized protein n=1 Tax=Streptomyces macrosporus TaxID=44032 RepID=A0ABP5XW64_9ACTN